MTRSDSTRLSALERAIRALQERSYIIDQRLLAHLSPLKWEHINLTGDYHWRRDGGLRNRKLRPLRSQSLPLGFAP
jgi:Tn3 transposase DDE domain